MKIFLDVGAHTGETLQAVLNPKYKFDKIVCFEPVEACCRVLANFQDPRIEICPFGLWRETCDAPIFAPGGLGANIFEDQGAEAGSEVCRLVRASDWFGANISKGHQVFLKLNCEGSECDIVDDLLSSGEYEKVHAVMIDFDARKIQSQKHRPQEVLERLRALGVGNYMLSEEAMIGPTHVARIQHWLRLVDGPDHPRLGLANAVRYVYLPYVGNFLRFFGARNLLRRLLPERGYLLVRSAWRGLKQLGS